MASVMLDEAAFRKVRKDLVSHGFSACLEATRACGFAREVIPPKDGQPAKVVCCNESSALTQRQSLHCRSFH